MAIISSEVATGRWIKGAEGFIGVGASPLAAEDCSRRAADRRRRHRRRRRRRGASATQALEQSRWTASCDSGTGTCAPRAARLWPRAQFLDVGAAGLGRCAAGAWARARVRGRHRPARAGRRGDLAAVGSGISTSAPSRRRSAPSTTTVSPGLRPDRIATLSPSCTPSLTVRWLTVLSGVTTKTKVPSAPRWIAATGITVWLLQRIHQKADIDELAGEQLAVGIVEHGAQLHRAGGGIDHIVHGGELAAGDLVGLAAVIGIDRQHGAAADPRHDLGDIVFRHGEEHRHGRQLGHHHDAGGLARRARYCRHPPDAGRRGRPPARRCWYSPD